MKKEIDLTTWKRKEHYNFFSSFEEPFFGITANVECTGAFQKAKEMDTSFFLYYMHKSLIAVNSIEEFHYRIEGGCPVRYDVVHGSTTVQNAEELFAFAFLPYHPDYDTFYPEAKASVERVKMIKGMGLDDNAIRNDVIHYSTLPWISFTAISHDRNFSNGDSIPKIAFGKFFRQGEKLLMPVSVNAHHGLMDGLHAGKYFELFQELLK